MINILRLILALLVSMAILQLGTGLFGTLLGYRASLEGFSRDAIGGLMAAYYLGFMIGTRLGVRLIMAVGHIRTFAAAAAVVSVVILIHPIVIETYTWAGLRFVAGLAIAGIFVVIESWLNGQATNETRGRVFSTYMLVNMLAMAGGQLFLQAASPAGPILFSLAAMLFAFSLVPVCVSTIKSPDVTEEFTERLSLLALYRASPLGVAGCFAVGLVNSSIWALGPSFAYDVGFDAAKVSYFMATILIGGVVLQWPIGYLSDLFDRRVVIAGVLVASMFASFAIAFFGTSELALFGLAALFGGMMLSLYSLCVSHTNDWIKPEAVVGASGGLLFVFGVGAIIGPLAGGYLSENVGPHALFMYTGGVCLVLLFFTAWRLLRRASPPADDKTDFVSVARTTPVVLSLYPRDEPGEGVAADTPPLARD